MLNENYFKNIIVFVHTNKHYIILHCLYILMNIVKEN